MKKLVILTVGVLALGAASAQLTLGAANAQTAQPASANYKIEVPLKNHLQMGMNEQDTFIEKPADSGKVYRITAGDTDFSAKLYAAASPTKHDPVDPKDIGPFAKGQMLGMTQGEWFKASGNATITCENGQGSVLAVFKDLVPAGVYTFWYSLMPTPFTEPFRAYL